MSTQATARQASQQTGATGTLVREVRDGDAYFIEPQLNVFGALMGGPHMDANGKEVNSPKIIKKTTVESYLVENFTDTFLPRHFTVTADAVAGATAVYVSTTDAALIPIYTLFQVAETGDVIFNNATANTGTGALTVVRYTGASAISAGMHLIRLGEIQGEVMSSIPYILRTLDNHYNYTAIFAKTWERSIRENAVKRIGGQSYTNDRKGKRREIMADMEANILGSKRSSSVGTYTATTPDGIEAQAATSGQLFDFEGTVERSELRELGIMAGTYGSNRKICVTSIAAGSAIQAALDDKLQVGISDLAKGNGLPMAKSLQLGPVNIEFVYSQFYGLPGKEGQGVIFDADLLEICELTPLQLYEAMDGEDHTQKTSKSGMWYYDGACPRFADAGAHLVKFVGALGYAG